MILLPTCLAKREGRDSKSKHAIVREAHLEKRVDSLKSIKHGGGGGNEEAVAGYLGGELTMGRVKGRRALSSFRSTREEPFPGGEVNSRKRK